MRRFSFLMAVLVGCTVPLAAGRSAPAGSAAATVVDLPVDGATQRLLYVPAASPRGVIVMLPGGAGMIGIAPDGALAHGDNFLVRSRAMFAAKGFGVVIPDAVGRGDLRGRRSTAEYAKVVEALVAFAKARGSGPVFLMGTSQGAIAAANGAAHLRGGQIAGAVLTESVSRLGDSGETVFSADLAAVNVPVLVVANRDDACKVAAPADAPRIAAGLSGSPEARVLTVSGGVRKGPDCSALSPHGYYGIEEQVVSEIAAWLNAHRK